MRPNTRNTGGFIPSRALKALRVEQARFGGPPSARPGGRLSLQIDQLTQNVVGGGHDPRIRLEATLGADEINEFFPQVYVRQFERARQRAAQAGTVRLADQRGSGVAGFL